MDDQTQEQTQESSLDTEVTSLPEDKPEVDNSSEQADEPEIGITSDGDLPFFLSTSYTFLRPLSIANQPGPRSATPER